MRILCLLCLLAMGCKSKPVAEPAPVEHQTAPNPEAKCPHCKPEPVSGLVPNGNGMWRRVVCECGNCDCENGPCLCNSDRCFDGCKMWCKGK